MDGLAWKGQDGFPDLTAALVGVEGLAHLGPLTGVSTQGLSGLASHGSQTSYLVAGIPQNEEDA